MSDDSDSTPGNEAPAPGGWSAVTRAFLMLAVLAMMVYYLGGRAGSFWRDSAPVVRDVQVMNTYARLTISEKGDGNRTPAELADLAEQAIRRVDALMSPFGEHSDVRRLNEAPAGQWVEVNPLTWTVVMESLRWHRLSGGAFDPTIGPVKRLFVFDQTETDDWPSEEAFREAKEKIGAEKILFDREGMRLAWKVDGMRLDLGAIAKGYSADLAAQVLVRNGVHNALIDVGGELRILGKKPGDPPTPWKAGVRNPRKGDFLETLDLTDAAVATSGDYERFFIYEGKRYEHIIDPRSGLPLAEGVAAVTVIHPSSCLAADALATTLCVLGPDAGRDFVKGQALGLFSAGVRVIMILPVDNGLRRLEFVVDGRGGFSESDTVIPQ